LDNVVNSDTLATFKKRLKKTHLFTASCETFLPTSASAFLIMALYKFFIVLYCIVAFEALVHWAKHIYKYISIYIYK